MFKRKEDEKMKEHKKILSLVLSALMIVSLIPSSVFAAEQGTEPAHFTEVVLNAENFPDPKFRQSITTQFGVEEGGTLNYEAAVNKQHGEYTIEFETDDFTGFNYIADIINANREEPNINLVAAKGRPFPFELIKDAKLGVVELKGSGEKKQILNYSSVYSLNHMEVLFLYYGNEEENMSFDPNKFSAECKSEIFRFKFSSAERKAAEKPFILDIKEIKDFTKLKYITINAYQFDLKDGIKISNNPKLQDITVNAATDKIIINNCPKLYNIYLCGTYLTDVENYYHSVEDIKNNPDNKFARYMPLEKIDISGCTPKRMDIYASFSRLKEVKTAENQIFCLTLYEGGASIARDDYPWLTTLWVFRKRFCEPHYEAPLKRDNKGNLYFDMNDIVGKEYLEYVDFSSSINETNGFKWDATTGHFTIGDSINGIKGLNYIYISPNSKIEHADAPLVVFLEYINQKPEVILNKEIKDNTITINKGEAFDATKYAKVRDIEDTKEPRVIDKTEVTGNVNSDVIGDYTVTYVAKDSKNLESEPVTLKVKVQEDPAVAALNKAKTDAKADLTKGITDYDAFKEVEEVKAAVVAGNKAIDDAATVEDVAKVAKAEKAKITEAVKTAKAEAEAKELAEAKAAKTAELDKVTLGVDEDLYTAESLEAAKAKLTELKAAAKEEVEKAKTIDAVNAVIVNVDQAKKDLITKEAAANAKVKEAEEKAKAARATATEKRNSADEALAEVKEAKDNAKNNEAMKAALELEKVALDKHIDALNAEVKAAEAEAEAAQVKATEFGTKENIAAAEASKETAEKAKANADKAVKEAENRQAEIAKEVKTLSDAIAVDEKIAAIGEVTLKNEQAVKDARTAYDALTEEAAKEVTQLDTLVAAEKKLAKLQEDAKKPETKPEVKPENKGNGKIAGSATVNKNGAPKTGDSENIFLWTLLMLAAVVAISKTKKEVKCNEEKSNR